MKFKKILRLNLDDAILSKPYWQRINKLTGKTVSLSKDDPAVLKNLADTECLLVNFGVDVTPEMIDAAPTLKYIGVLATAFGRIDAVYAKKRKVVVCNLPGYSTEAVAEFTLAAILENIKQLEEGKIRGRRAQYSEKGMSAIEIKGKIFGVVGLGGIGGRVAEIAQGFGADVRYWSRNRKKEAEKKGIKYETLDSLVKKADFLSLNLAQNSETDGILNKKRIQSIKKGAVVVNTAPMELVDIDALEVRLKRGDITFVLDHSDEMSEVDLKKLSKYKNCIIYPPIAYITKEAGIARQEMFTSNIENFLKGTPKNTVN